MLSTPIESPSLRSQWNSGPGFLPYRLLQLSLIMAPAKYFALVMVAALLSKKNFYRLVLKIFYVKMIFLLSFRKPCDAILINPFLSCTPDIISPFLLI